MALPDHLFSSEDGALYDTRQDDWNTRPALRPNYRRTHAQVTNVADLKATLRAGEFAWPGGYQMFFVNRRGEALSFEGVRAHLAEVIEDMQSHAGAGLTGVGSIVACEINYEDTSLYCELTGKDIPAAYEPDEEDEDQ